MSTALVLRADTGRVCNTKNVVWIARGTAVMPAPVPTPGGGGLRSPRRLHPLTDAPSAAAAPPPEPDYTISFTLASAPPAASVPLLAACPLSAASPSPVASPLSATSPPIFNRSYIPTPISVATSSLAPSASFSPLPPFTDSVAKPSHPPLTAMTARLLRLGIETRVHGRTRSDGVRFMEEQQRQVPRLREPPPQPHHPPPSPSGSGAFHHRLGLLLMMNMIALISSIITGAAIAGGHCDLPPPQNPGDGGKGGEGARGAVIHACDDVHYS